MSRVGPLFLLFLCACGAGARADPGYYVVNAYDQAGISTAEVRYWTFKPRGGTEWVWPEVGFGHGITSRWTTLVLASFMGPSDLRTRLSLWSWQNNVLLTQGELPFDLAVHANLIRPADRSQGRVLELGPVFQTDIGRTQINANLLFERSFGAEQASATALKYQWQLRHRWRPGLHVGLQGFGELGTWNHWAPRQEQSHRAGPAVFATLPLQGDTTVKVQAALLLGSTYAQHGHMFTMRMAVDF